MTLKYGLSKNKKNCVSFMYLLSIADITNFIKMHNRAGTRALVLVS